MGIDPRVLQGSLLMALVVVAIALGAWLISYLRRQMIEEAEDRADALTQFQEAYDAGEIDADEYRRVREALGRQAAGQDGGGLPRPPGRTPRTESTPEAESGPPPGR